MVPYSYQPLIKPRSNEKDVKILFFYYYFGPKSPNILRVLRRIVQLNNVPEVIGTGCYSVSAVESRREDGRHSTVKGGWVGKRNTHLMSNLR